MNQLLSSVKNNNPLALALGIVAVIAAVYYFGKKTVKDVAEAGSSVAQAAAGLVSGNNAVTQHQTNWDGSKQTAYEGKGVFGTLGAAANSASGGALSSIGDSIGGTAADVTDAVSSWWDRLLTSDSNPSN